MKILVTGANGMLGSALVRIALERGMTCTPLSRERIWSELPAELSNYIGQFDLLVHAAANTDVEGCESDPASCYHDNLLLTEMVVSAATPSGVPVVFISSTGVYGVGKEEPYREYDQAAPTTHHHTSKFLAEAAVLRGGGANLVVRTGWLFGGEVENRKNFVARRMEQARAARDSEGVVETNAVQRGVPCFSDDIAERILLLASRRYGGLFNCVNSGHANRHEYVKAILDMAGIEALVTIVDPVRFQRKAKVSNNEMAENWKMDRLGLPPMRHWREGLAHYMDILLRTGV